MAKLALLKFDGNFEQGFVVTLQILEDDCFPFIEITGKLPPAPEIYQHYKSWQLGYYKLGSSLRKLEARFQEVSNFSLVDIKKESQIFSYSLNAWLDCDEFRRINEQLWVNLDPSDEFRVLIQAGDTRLRQLPWHLWKFFEIYSKAEVAFSAREYARAKNLAPIIPINKVRILAILGDSRGINIHKDTTLLAHLPNAETIFLVEPNRKELYAYLYDEQGWDILFFAGHSESYDSFALGRIYINRRDSLTISDLKYALIKAIERGLKLAIFNSCDGLGLVNELEDLNIPQVIAMRQPVPDLVAQEFLKYFLVAFSSGKSLYTSVREARERLQGLEEEFPCASWLPVISQNPAEVPVTWQELQPKKNTISSEVKGLLKNQFLLTYALSIALLCGQIVFNIRDNSVKPFISRDVTQCVRQD